MVERGLHPGHHRASGGTTTAGQPGGTGNNGLLPDNQPGSPLDGVGPQSNNSAVGEQTAELWATAAEPTAGGPGGEVVGAPTGIGRRLTNALAYGGQTESTVLLEEPETLNAELLQ